MWRDDAMIAEAGGPSIDPRWNHGSMEGRDALVASISSLCL